MGLFTHYFCQDAVLHLLHKKHQEERQLLVEMLINPRFENVQRDAALESDQQRNDRLAVLKAKRQSSTLGQFSMRFLCFFFFLNTCYSEHLSSWSFFCFWWTAWNMINWNEDFLPY